MDLTMDGLIYDLCMAYLWLILGFDTDYHRTYNGLTTDDSGRWLVVIFLSVKFYWFKGSSMITKV